jgi:PKD repeat protein
MKVISFGLLLIFIGIVSHGIAKAQFRYIFKDTSTPYAPLSASAISLNGSTKWTGKKYVAPMPFTWKLDSNILVSGMPLDLINSTTASDTNNVSDVNGFFLGFVLGIDRGDAGPGSLSPIRYKTVGTAPQRIFKLEIANAGFSKEQVNHGTLSDSFSLQIWVYETSNILELHFGPSRITYPSEYFSFGSGPHLGYMQHTDLSTSTHGNVYYVASNGTSTRIDTMRLPFVTPPTNNLNAWPASGRVFRFTPFTLCPSPVASFASSPQTGNAVLFTYTGTTVGLDSLVYYFGDGSKQVLLGSYTTPITHNYAVAGRYSATVTAYSQCGATTSASLQSTVSIDRHSALGAFVSVYPNPVTDVLTIEGLQGNGIAAIASADGRIVLRQALNSGGTINRISIAWLPAGTYILTISGSDAVSGSTILVRK